MNQDRHQLQSLQNLSFPIPDKISTGRITKENHPELFNYKGEAIPYVPYQDGQTIKDKTTTTIRNDGGKNRVDLLPVKPLERISEVLTVALEKYPARNWEPGMAWSRCYASALRHLFAWWRGEDHDPQTGLSHLAHCACNILFLLEYEESKRGTDDRPK